MIEYIHNREKETFDKNMRHIAELAYIIGGLDLMNMVCSKLFLKGW